MRRPSSLVALVSPLAALLACSDDPAPSEPHPGAPDDGGVDVCPETPAPQKPAASCDVTIEAPPIMPGVHVPEGTPLTYCSTPPSSGRHYPVWAAFQEYAAPVDWPYLVHSMEHGAVVLLYRCAPPGCPEIVEQLRAVRDALPPDPKCAGQPTARRIIVAPSDAIDTKIAAAAWGATYRADCLDAPTLEAFVRDRYGKGPEDLCFPGREF